MGGQALGSSFRDPSGFVYTRDGALYRQVNRVFQERFEAFLGSGLYDELVRERLLVPHAQVALELAASHRRRSPCSRPSGSRSSPTPTSGRFGQLRDAALLTLELQERALARGFTLRDASAYNVQFVDGRPVFIDTLSFEPREEGAPWAAYGQFCEHFLVPLALMSRVDVRCRQPAAVSSRRDSARSRQPAPPAVSLARPGLLFHVHLHAWPSGGTPTGHRHVHATGQGAQEAG